MQYFQGFYIQFIGTVVILPQEIVQGIVALLNHAQSIQIFFWTIYDHIFTDIINIFSVAGLQLVGFRSKQSILETTIAVQFFQLMRAVLDDTEYVSQFTFIALLQVLKNKFKLLFRIIYPRKNDFFTALILLLILPFFKELPRTIFHHLSVPQLIILSSLIRFYFRNRLDVFLDIQQYIQSLLLRLLLYFLHVNNIIYQKAYLWIVIVQLR